ncbi:MAG: hypothetical protein LUH19_07155 [Lachnospiraceae bacterium]|nr:hypothetical protein [Lachnospiraceae bacterium]
MNKKIVATLAVAALLALAPVGIKGAITASASSNDTASSNTTTEADQGKSEAEVYMEYLDTVNDEIVEAAKAAVADGETGVVTLDAGEHSFSLYNGVMQQLYKSGNVDFVVTFVYNGVTYTITIPAGEAVDDDIPWYGPLYLIQYYGTVEDQISVSAN